MSPWWRLDALFPSSRHGVAPLSDAPQSPVSVLSFPSPKVGTVRPSPVPSTSVVTAHWKSLRDTVRQLTQRASHPRPRAGAGELQAVISLCEPVGAVAQLRCQDRPVECLPDRGTPGAGLGEGCPSASPSAVCQSGIFMPFTQCQGAGITGSICFLKLSFILRSGQ